MFPVSSKKLVELIVNNQRYGRPWSIVYGNNSNGLFPTSRISKFRFFLSVFKTGEIRALKFEKFRKNGASAFTPF